MADYYDQLDYIKRKIHFSVDIGEREHWVRQHRFLYDHMSKVRNATDIIRSWDYPNNVLVDGGSGLGTSSTVKKSDPNKNHNKKLLAARRMINGTGVKTA